MRVVRWTGMLLAALIAWAAAAGPAAQPVRATVRDRGEGGVTVTATWLGVEDGALRFRVSLDTHSVDLLGFDVQANTALRTAPDRETKPLRWQEERTSAHHRAGVLVFAAPGVWPERMSLVVRNLAGVPERVLTFELGW